VLVVVSRCLAPFAPSAGLSSVVPNERILLILLAVVEATLDKHVRPDCTVQYIPGYLVKDADQLHHPAGGRKAEAELRLFVSFDTSNVFWFPL
jgi:hypothetical protein